MDARCTEELRRLLRTRHDYPMDDDARGMHLAVCRRFGVAVVSADGKWHRQSPCPAWNAGDVVEHVIGFHDVLLLRPLGCKPERPRTDPLRRWELTFERIEDVMSRTDVFDRDLAIPPMQNNPATRQDASALIPRLTQDVLVHTWDLAQAVGTDACLDPTWCAHFLDRLPTDLHALSRSGMFASPVDIGGQADSQARLLARLGRDPHWPRRSAEQTFRPEFPPAN